ncbi:hypothetical protein SAMN05444161_0007 [Rhizobiales bacterium GAS191]|nr:hypothetical protein SAMN05444161_0007 [Rhizobiales bacterium GAS191]
MHLLVAVGELGEEVWQVFEQSMRASDHLERATEQQARACLELFSDCEDPAELARGMLKAMADRKR